MNVAEEMGGEMRVWGGGRDEEEMERGEREG